MKGFVFTTMLLLVQPAVAQKIECLSDSMTLRGQQQELYRCPPPDKAASAPLVLFLPGDGGWRGDAIDMAKEIAKAGYLVYGWNVKDYLEDFTGGVTLTTAEMTSDIAAVTEWVAKKGAGKVILVGWSQGAGMAVLAAASPAHKHLYSGVLGVGTPERAVRAWHLTSNLTYLTRKEPDEPSFSIPQYLPEVAPLRYAAINATEDSAIPPSVAGKLFAAAAEPKRVFTIEARGHNFGSNRPAFYAALREALAWIRQ